MLPKSYKEENRFESVMELYEAGCTDYIYFNGFRYKLEITNERKEVLGIHICGNDQIKL